MRLIDDNGEMRFLDNRWVWPRKAGTAICALMSTRGPPKANPTLILYCVAWRERSPRGDDKSAPPPIAVVAGDNRAVLFLPTNRNRHRVLSQPPLPPQAPLLCERRAYTGAD